MAYLKRKVDTFLSEWKSNPDKKPLIIKGPRQVGKTESIKKFAELNYKNFIEINFVEEIEKNIGSNNLEEELKDFMIDISQYSFDDKTLGVMKYER